MKQRFQFLVTILVLAVLIFLGLAKWLSGIYTDWLWFGSLHYQQVFLTILFSELGLRLAVGLAVFVLLFLNLLVTRGSILAAVGGPVVKGEEEGGVVTLYQSPLARLLGPRTVLATFFLLSLVLAFFISFTVSGDWVVLQQFLHPTAFHVTDPLFGRDVGFYVFKLPFYSFIYQLLLWIIILTAFWVTVVYFLVTMPKGFGQIFKIPAARWQLSALAFVFFLVKAWGYLLDQYYLLYSQEGVVFGAGYTDVHAVLLGYRVLLVIALLCAAAAVFNLVLRRFRLVPAAIGLLIVTSVLLLNIYPALVQKLIVAPNEFDKEKAYIQRSIAFTRQAYDLNKISEQNFPAGQPITRDELAANQGVVNSIRLWDEAPLQDTYNQIQTMRLYYTFPQIDVDRYTLDGQYRQVMLGVREIDQTQLPDPARTWVNEKLKYTHGYGIAMSPVNEFTSGGLPTFFLKNIPPESATDLKITNPAIYYGESTNGYVLVDTDTQEFDYPKGDDNAYTTYKGDGGVLIGNAWRRLLFAFSLGDYKLLLSTDVTDATRVLYYRNITQRVPKIAPFLRFDHDPYPVIADGRIYWMWDAYTETNMYPYAQPVDNGNDYIRNSVKAVVDAYTGDVTFYVSDPSDPLIQTWSKIFPGMFVPLNQMPASLRAHIRYPVDYFTVQAQMYATYHMTDPQVFYNKEDKWSMPTDLQAGQEKPLAPYYIITRLPGQAQPEYVLLLPFTPQNKKNMVAWMAARMDPPNYGKLIVYDFPKQEQVNGPMQIEALIDQNTTISAQLSLWNQQGSRVIRGNLMIIPIDQGILYVEPLYLQAEQSKMPELARVIALQGTGIAMEPTLEQALEQLFQAAPPSPNAVTPQANPADTLRQLIVNAGQVFDQAQKQLQSGNWAGYGDDLRQLKSILGELSQKTQGNLPSNSSP